MQTTADRFGDAILDQDASSLPAKLAADEESPLLGAARPDQPTPLPVLQLTILLLLLFMETITFHLIAPFTPQLIVEVGVTHGDESKIGFYAGILQASFFAAQGFTVLGWGSLSDRIGRKPVFLAELLGIAISVLAFGLSHTYTGLLSSRMLCGALNGGVAVMRSMIVEITDTTNIARAFSLSPISWTMGGIIGPLIGGFLSHPEQRFPGLFGDFPFFKAYPYFLPCSVPAIFATGMIFVVRFYLKETVINPISTFRFVSNTFRDSSSQDGGHNSPALPFGAFLTSKILTSTLCYVMVSAVDIGAKSLLPVFFTTSLGLGGLGYSTSMAGTCMAALGCTSAAFQFLIMPRLHKAIGSRNLFLLGMAASIPMFALCPAASYLARVFWNRHWTVSLSLAIQFVLLSITNMGFACVFIYLASAAPNSQSLGATNGIAQVAVSFIRAISPFLIGALYSFTIGTNALGGWLVWIVLFGLGFLAFCSGLLLPRTVWPRPG